jgi:molecular chaperone DnaJ
MFAQQFRQQRQAQETLDIRIKTTISLKDAVFGTKKTIDINYQAPCEPCKGTGSKDAATTKCSACNGKGRAVFRQGHFEVHGSCPYCWGSGIKPKDSDCSSCNGSRTQTVQRKVKINIPAGIDNGQTLRLQGQGCASVTGSSHGDLYVSISIAPHQEYERHDQNLVTQVKIPFSKALLGGEATITTLDDATKTITIAPSTQPGSILRFAGEGVPHIRDNDWVGDLIVIVNIEVPTVITEEIRQKTIELQQAIDASLL